MEIILDKNLGYCWGVKRTLRLADKAIEKYGSPLYSVGPLVHNPQEVKRLEGKGVKIIEDINEIETGVVIIRSHGVAPHVLRMAEAKGLKIIDATCPFIKEVRRKALNLLKDGYRVIIFGEKDHPEVLGMIGELGEKAEVVENCDDVKKLPPGDNRFGLICQTTQREEVAMEIANTLMKMYEDGKVELDTLCATTNKRQKDVRRFAEGVDAILVVGGYGSSNTKRLVEICKEVGVKTYHIEVANEIRPEWFGEEDRVGITAGGSTPEWVVKEVVDRMYRLQHEKKISGCPDDHPI